MTGHFQSRFTLGDKVTAMGLSAEVVAITFTGERTIYEVRFDSGGANGRLDSTEVGPC
jgi:hypothetical protein